MIFSIEYYLVVAVYELIRLVQLYLENKSFNTIKTYHFYFLRFINTYRYTGMAQINNFSAKEINEYHYNFKQGKHYSVKTVNQSINAVKYYYKQVLKKDFVLDSVVRGKKAKEKPNFHSAVEMEKILNATLNIKHRAMLIILFSSGLRVSELLSLRPKDILADRGQLFVKGGKGMVDRYTVLSETALKVLRKYIEEYKPEEYLFEGQYGGKYSGTSLRKVFETSLKKAGVPKKGSVHILRHSFATQLIENGVDLRIVQKLLGHRSLKTTETYLHVTNQHLRSIRSPLDNLNVRLFGKDDKE